MNSHSKILISVVMITYNHEKFLSEAIESVLNQKVDCEFELIIADDCSPDQTKVIVNQFKLNHPKGYAIKYHRHEKNIGMIPNFLFSLKESKGDLIALCDGDDYWIDSNKLQNQKEILLKNNDIKIVYSDCLIDFEEKNRLLNYSNQLNFDLYDYLSQKYFTASPSLIFKKPIFDFTNNFLKTPIGDEYLVSFLLKNGGRCYYSPKPTAFYRIHNGGVFSKKKTVCQLFFKLKTLDLLISEFSHDNKAVSILKKEIKNNIDRLFNYTFDGFHGLKRWDVFKLLIKFQPEILFDYRFYYNWFIKRIFEKK